MRKRRWIGTGIVEAFDARQLRLLDQVLAMVRHYYRDLYESRDCYRYPLSLSGLMKLSRCNGPAALNAVRVLAHSVDIESEKDPPLVYDRTESRRNATHRPYRIFLRNRRNGARNHDQIPR